jgi:hypothetical protein
LTWSKIDEDSDQGIYEEPSYAIPIPIPYLLLIGLGLIFASLSQFGNVKNNPLGFVFLLVCLIAGVGVGVTWAGIVLRVHWKINLIMKLWNDGKGSKSE